MLLPLLGIRVAVGPRPTKKATEALLAGSLTAGWVGDVAIDRSFRHGLGAFFVGHLGLIALFASDARSAKNPVERAHDSVARRRDRSAATRPRSESSIPRFVAYAVVLAAMAASSTRGNRRTAFGGMLFAASDTMIALRQFTPWLRSSNWRAAVMGTYLAAQGLIVDGTLSPRDEVRAGEHENEADDRPDGDDLPQH